MLRSVFNSLSLPDGPELPTPSAEQLIHPNASVKLADVRVSVVEINPKNGSLNEAPLLKTIWAKWLGEMHAACSVCIQKYSLSNSQAKLRESLESD